MHMTLNRRMHLLLDERRYRKVASVASQEGVSVATVIRRAIDALPDTDARRVAAIDTILSAPRIPVPADPADLRQELDAVRDRHR